VKYVTHCHMQRLTVAQNRWGDRGLLLHSPILIESDFFTVYLWSILYLIHHVNLNPIPRHYLTIKLNQNRGIKDFSNVFEIKLYVSWIDLINKAFWSCLQGSPTNSKKQLGWTLALQS
jgi:hypothetical protein